MKTILTLTTLIISILSYGQSNKNQITYDYDLAGNRILRKMIVVVLRPEHEEELDALSNGVDKAAETETVETANDTEAKNEKEMFKEELDNVSLNLYPNPTAGALQIDIPDISAVNQGLIRLYDINGKILHEERVTSSETSIDLSQLEPATYILLLNINGKTSEWKVVRK